MMQKYSLDSKSILIGYFGRNSVLKKYHAVAQHPLLDIKLFKDVFPVQQLHITFFLLLVVFIVPRVSWLVNPLDSKAYCQFSNVILVIAVILSIFTSARLWKLMVKWRSSMISWGRLSLPSIINFGGALHLNELSYRPRIGRILKSKDNSLKWDQSEIYNFIRLEAVLL